MDGGLFAAEDVRMNGNTHVNYNQEYMDAIDDMDIPTGMTVVSWNEIPAE